MHLNSVISTKGAQYCTIDLENFYLNTPMECPEYMQMNFKDLPQEFDDMCNLAKIVENDSNVYIKIRKGMYGLPQAGILAQQQLEQQLNEQGYHQSTITPGLWKHKTRYTSFTLCVNDFGVKYVEQDYAEHLLQVLNATTNAQ